MLSPEHQCSIQPSQLPPTSSLYLKETTVRTTCHLVESYVHAPNKLHMNLIQAAFFFSPINLRLLYSTYFPFLYLSICRSLINQINIILSYSFLPSHYSFVFLFTLFFRIPFHPYIIFSHPHIIVCDFFSPSFRTIYPSPFLLVFLPALLSFCPTIFCFIVSLSPNFFVLHFR